MKKIERELAAAELDLTQDEISLLLVILEAFARNAGGPMPIGLRPLHAKLFEAQRRGR